MNFNPERNVRLKQDILNNILAKTSIKNPAYAKEFARKWAGLR